MTDILERAEKHLDDFGSASVENYLILELVEA